MNSEQRRLVIAEGSPLPRGLQSAGAAIIAPGLANASSNVRLPDNVSLSVTSGSSAIFQALGNAAAGTTYTVTDVPSGRTLRVIVSVSGRVCLASPTATVCP